MTTTNVTWATSQTQAEVAMKKADELLERQQWDRALEQLAAAQRAMATTIQFVNQERYAARSCTINAGD